MRGGVGPLGAGSACAEASQSAGRPLNLVLYIPFTMFAYSSNNFKANFDPMVAMPLISYGSATGHREREREEREGEGRERERREREGRGGSLREGSFRGTEREVLEGPRGKFERDREGSLRRTEREV